MSSSPQHQESAATTAGDPRPHGVLDAVVEHDDRHGAIVVGLTGEIDFYTLPELRTVLRDAQQAHPGARLLVIDLRASTSSARRGSPN